MNKNLRDIELQARAKWEISRHLYESFEHLFAELIIEKCISIATNADRNDKFYAWYAIEQHFKD